MIRAVLDANTIVSGMARFDVGSSPPVLILREWMSGRVTLLISDWLLDEVTRTLAKPYFQSQVAVDVYDLITELLRTTAIRVPIGTPRIGIASHPEDDFVLATAVSAQADYLVTGDKQLRRLGQLENVVIVSPRDFFDCS